MSAVAQLGLLLLLSVTVQCGEPADGSYIHMTDALDNNLQSQDTIPGMCRVCKTVARKVLQAVKGSVNKEKIDRALDGICSKLMLFVDVKRPRACRVCRIVVRGLMKYVNGRFQRRSAALCNKYIPALRRQCMIKACEYRQKIMKLLFSGGAKATCQRIKGCKRKRQKEAVNYYFD